MNTCITKPIERSTAFFNIHKLHELKTNNEQVKPTNACTKDP